MLSHDLAWLEEWRGEFNVAQMMDLSRWEVHRGTVRHPATIFTADDIQMARTNVVQHAWAAEALERVLRRIEAAGSIDRAWAERYISAITPYAPHFTMCPRCEFAPMHGAYAWDPAEPQQIRCKGCGAVYPNAEYPEDLVFQSKFDPGQIITLYGGKSWPAYGYTAIHSSFSGHARIHACRHAANLAEDLAFAYALTGDPSYATAAGTLLNRFADVHPRYLVHSAYGDIADMDPKLAAISANHLPEDEWCPPGNRPDRKLYPGYWMVLRWGSSAGMEGAALQKLILAYDLVAETLADDRRCHIERDLFLDAAPLLFADPAINNKTGMNRGAVALIGMVCGDPLLVRFGLDGFVRAVRDWWLPDGGTPESTGYASMMLHGIWRVAEALKQYTDPEGVDLAPGRLDHLDLYRWPRYRAVWQGMVRPLLPSLDYPMLADNRLPCHLSAMLADVLVRNYPNENHRALRQAIDRVPRCYEGRIAQFWYAANLDAIAPFYRQTEPPVEAPPRFEDDLGPYLKIGVLRSQSSTVILSAADWKGHHHCDHLNLYLWKDGRELLTDLGYLWDMEAEIPKVRRTLAHNLVLVDGEEQKSVGRRGQFEIFSTRGPVKVMEASSNVYASAPTYRRTVAVVGSGSEEYIVDIFRVTGGQIHDWVMHGSDNSLQIDGLPLKPLDTAIYDLAEVHSGNGASSWTGTWHADSAAPFRVHVPGMAGEKVFVGQGFGQRKAHDRGATLPYLVRRRQGGSSLFVTAYSSGNAVKSVSIPFLDLETMNVVVRVVTATGSAWIASTGPERAPICTKVNGKFLEIDGCFAYLSAQERFLIGGDNLTWGDLHMAQSGLEASGPIYETFSTPDESGFITQGNRAALLALVGSHLSVEGSGDSPSIPRWYPILALEERRGHPALITRRGDRGYDIRTGSTWRAWDKTWWVEED
jgi:hypothetical protein